jgi:hypothetical protein
MVDALNITTGTRFAVCLETNVMIKRWYMVLSVCALLGCATGATAQVERDRGGDGKEKNKDIPTNNATPMKNIEKVVGTWEASGIFNGAKDLTDTDTVGINSSFEFTRENKYLSYSDREQIDSGTFKLNEVQNVLYLESAGGNEVAEYKIRFDDNTMTLQPMQSADANAQRFRYVYTRKASGSK